MRRWVWSSGLISQMVRLARLTRLLLQEIFASSSQTLTPFLHILQSFQHIPHLRLAIPQQPYQAIAFLPQSNYLRKVIPVQAILFMLGEEGERGKVIMELLRGDDRCRVK